MASVDQHLKKQVPLELQVAKPRSIKLFSDQFTIPAQQSVWLGSSGNIGEGFQPT